MGLPLLLMNVQVFSTDMDARYLTSKEAVLRDGNATTIKIPLCAAKSVNGGPVVGKHYFLRYMDGIEQSSFNFPEFKYLGLMNEQLVFSSVLQTS
jgi:hypothetical protein